MDVDPRSRSFPPNCRAGPRAPLPPRLQPLNGSIIALVLCLFVLGAQIPASAAGVRDRATVDALVERLNTEDEFRRARTEAELLRLGTRALPALAQSLHLADRKSRFRAIAVFSHLMRELLTEYGTEHVALLSDTRRQLQIEKQKRSVEAQEELKSKTAALSAADPEIEDKLASLYQLEQLKRSEEGLKQQPPEVAESYRARIADLEDKYAAWKEADADFEDKVRPLVELYVAEVAGHSPFTELDALRLEELNESIADRTPRVESLKEQILDVGISALNEALAQRRFVPATERAVFAHLVAEGVTRFGGAHLTIGEEFEVVRYTHALLWADEVERGQPEAEQAKRLLTRHLDLVLRDLGDHDPVVAKRAADELFLLGEHGLAALDRSVAASSADNQGQRKFLRELLHWQIPPSTYDRVGIDFSKFHQLPFQQRRRFVFDYARVAGREAISTLHKVIERDDSLMIKLAAAKALAGLRDLSGYNFLVRNYPEMTLKKPEVSRELLIAQAYEHIREKKYALAVGELRRVLDEAPFDFRANYHIAFAYLLLHSYAKSIHHFEIARRINPKDQLTLYNLACAYALVDQHDAALEALESSVDAGFSDHDHMEKDPDLESLRSAERYRRLIEKMKQTSAE